jgi:transposase
MLISHAAYDSDRLLVALKKRRSCCCIKPVLAHTLARYRPRRKVYAQRKHIERLFKKPKHLRAISSLFEKRSANYLALVKLASTRLSMPFLGL